MSRITRFLLSLSLLLPVSASAQQTVQEEIVVTASAMPEPVSSVPAAVSVITREEIDRQKARDVADVLRQVPGLSISRSGSAGKSTTLFTRGSNSTHTLVLLDGVEINNPYFAGYDWGRFSTTGIEQIEVVRGPYSALYGSDAVAGVVNILTTPTESGASLRLEGGDEGFFNGALDAAAVTGAFSARLSAERREDDGFAPNDDFGQDSAVANLQWRGARTHLGFTARYTSYELGIPTNINAAGTEIVPSPNRRQEGDELQLSLPVRFTAGRTQLDFVLSESRRDDDFSDPDDPFFLTESSTESTTRRARLQVQQTTSSFGTLIGGAEVERAEVDDLSSYGVNLDGDRRDATSFFLEDRLTVPAGTGRIEAVVGARWDDFDTFGDEISPRVSAAYVVGGLRIHAAYGEAFRAPSVGELYYPFFGNATLEAENSRTTEAGVESRVGATVLSATVFDNRFDNLIVYDNALGTFGNVGRASSRGVETGLRTETAGGFFAGVTYTYLETEDESTGEQLYRRPKHSGSLDAGVRRGPLTAEVIVTYNGTRDDLLPVFPYSRVSVESVTTADALLSWRSGRFEPYVRVENVTNEEYEEVLGFASPGRRAVVGVRLTSR